MSEVPEQAPRWADIGVNLGDKQFAEDSEQVLGRATDSGVALMLLTGTSVLESETAVALCRQWADAGPALFATAGIHPHNARFFDSQAGQTLARNRRWKSTSTGGRKKPERYYPQTCPRKARVLAKVRAARSVSLSPRSAAIRRPIQGR